MSVVSRPDYSVGVWASNGDVAAPTSEKIEIGHIVEKPLKEVMNWIQNRQDRGIVYLMQQGISEWVSTETYPLNAYVKRSGVIYKAYTQNEDRDPLSNPDIWKLAFDTYGSAAAVQLEVDKIKNEEGYLDLYVSKNNPVLNSRAEGVSYVAAEGVPTLTSDEYGYTFKNHLLSGLFIAGNDPVILKDGVEVARFSPPLNSNENSKKVVTMDILLDFIQTYKVGDLYITTQNENPTTRLGYGTWERYAEGKALVGFSSSTSNKIPEWVKTGGGEFGEYSVELLSEHSPPHTHYAVKMGGDVSDLDTVNNVFTNSHRTQSDYNGYISGGALSSSIADSGKTSNPINSNGLPLNKATPHNNVQPSITVYVWRRVS